MSENSEMPHASSGPTVIVCSNCHSTMPSELRFCRNCGFRLGTTFGNSGQPFVGANLPAVDSPAPSKKRRRMSGMSWIFVGLLVFFVGAAAFTAIISPIRHAAGVIQNPIVAKSYVGVDGWDSTDGGVTFGSIDAPGGPADKAGLVGGDIITKFDGQQVHDEDEMDDLMKRTPIGKTVDIEYLRDGEKKTTKLTTISQEEFKRISKEFERRPEGRAQFGYEDGDAKRVQVPGTNIYGVKLNTILQSRPADMAGIKNGDIVIEFDGVPIRTSDEFLMRVRRAVPYSTVKIVVMRGNGDEKNSDEKLEKLEIPVKMGKQ